MMSEKEANEIKDRYSMRLLNMPGVISVGVEQDEKGDYFIALRVSTDDPAALEQLPAQIEGCPIKIGKSKEYRKLPLKSKNRDQT